MVFLSFFSHFLVLYSLNIGLNWLINTLEFLLILFPVNSYYFRLINGLIGQLMVFFVKFRNPLFVPIPTPASALVVP